jgi:hypothetical protein
MSRYNGWANRETWLVGLWFNPETLEDVEHIKMHLEDIYYESETFKGFWQDMINYTAIDWEEIRDSVEEELKYNEEPTPAHGGTGGAPE